jgi:hypothetical protein
MTDQVILVSEQSPSAREGLETYLQNEEVVDIMHQKLTQKVVERLQYLYRDQQNIYVSASGDVTVLK